MSEIVGQHAGCVGCPLRAWCHLPSLARAQNNGDSCPAKNWRRQRAGKRFVQQSCGEAGFCDNDRSMKRFVPLLALLFVAATSLEENRQFHVAEAAFNDKLYDVATRQLHEFLEKYPQSPRTSHALYLLGRTQLNLNDWETAIHTLQSALAKWPDKRADGVVFWLGEAHSWGGEFAAAETRYLELIEKYPWSELVPAAWYELAAAQFREGRYDAATASLDKLARLHPPAELLLDADLLHGQLLLARQDYGKADTALEAVARKAGNASRAFYRANYWLGESLARRQQFAAALARYAIVTDAFKAKPNQPVDAQLAGDAWFATGWAHWNAGEFAAAGEAFKMTLATATRRELKRDALLKVAECAAWSGQPGDSVAGLKDFLVSHPGDPLADAAQLAIGDLLFNKGDHAAALTEYARLLTTYTNSSLRARAGTQAGWCAWQLQQYPTALDYFQKALPLVKDDAAAVEVEFKIADVHFALGQFSEATGDLQRLLAAHPHSAALDRAQFQLGEAFRRAGNGGAAAAAFAALVQDYPQSALAPQAQYNLGQLRAAEHREAEARAAFAAVVSNFPATVWASNAVLAVGESFAREGCPEAASAEFDKLTGNGLDSELAQQAFYSRGWVRPREQTLAEFTEFLKTHPQAKLAADIQYWIADDYLRQRDYLKAQAQFQSLAETYPASHMADAAQYFAGRAAYGRQDFATAIKLYEALVKKFPQSNWRCEARFGQGDALSELGKFDDALLVFEALTKEFPDCSLTGEAWGRKGDCQYSLSRYDDALASYRKALDLATETGLRHQALFKLGQTFEAQKKLDDAVQQYTKALYEATVGPVPAEPVERFWSCKAARAAANIKEQQNQWSDAITLYKKLGKLCPDLNELADDRIRKLITQHPETLLGR